MRELCTENLALASRLFIDRAYPAGPQAIPAKKRPYYDAPFDAPLENYLPPSPAAAGVCQIQPDRKGSGNGYTFRLGSSHFPHIKLSVLPVMHHDKIVWVWTVDTHDALPHTALVMTEAEALLWRDLQRKNASLKQQVEEAFEQAGFLTGKSLLRLDL